LNSSALGGGARGAVGRRLVEAAPSVGHGPFLAINPEAWRPRGEKNKGPEAPGAPEKPGGSALRPDTQELVRRVGDRLKEIRESIPKPLPAEAAWGLLIPTCVQKNASWFSTGERTALARQVL
jgi:hypothetical protein